MTQSHKTLSRSPTFWLILLTCIAPIAITLILYYSGYGKGAQPAEALIPPPLLATHDGSVRLWPTGAALSRQERWAMVVACDPQTTVCTSLLDTARRLHVALGKDFARVQRLWVPPAGAPLPLLKETSQRYPDLIIVNAPPDWQALLQPAPSIWILDPNDRLRLRYLPPVAEKKLFLTMSRLLRYSWIS